jgi:hypothetical protein
VSVLVSVWTLTPLKPLLHLQFSMEAEVGIEPTDEAFAEPCLTTWLPRRSNENNQLLLPCKNAFGKYDQSSKVPMEKSPPPKPEQLIRMLAKYLREEF